MTSIGNDAFRDCFSLTSVTIPTGVTSIGNYAFAYCSSLTSITIPDGVTSIGDQTFNGCSSLTSVTIPDGVTSIGHYAFSGCSSLTSVTIPNSVTSIGNWAFNGCYYLKDFWCYAENVPATYSNTFAKLDISSATLHVPAASLEAYRTTAPWSGFGTIVPCDGPIVLNENSTTFPAAATNADVRVKRTINANEWSTIVLPFAMTEAQVKEAFGEDVQLADFTGYDVTEADGSITGITVNFNNVTAIEANHPYIIKVGTAVTEFTVDGVNIEPEDAPCVAFGSEYGRPRKYHPMDFVGTYTADFDFFNDAQSGHAIFLSGGKFWYATASTRHMKAFRAYFDFDDILTSVEEASGAIEFKFDFDDATGIKAIDHSTIDHYYNLSGQRVGKNYKGIVVTKGKKVLR